MEPSLPFGNNLLADGLTVEAVRIWPWLRQTNWLRHAALLGLPDSYLQDCNPTPLSLAQEALSRLFDFVGITEQLDLVAQCVTRDLGASPPSLIGRHNAGAGDTLKAYGYLLVGS